MACYISDMNCVANDYLLARIYLTATVFSRLSNRLGEHDIAHYIENIGAGNGVRLESAVTLEDMQSFEARSRHSTPPTSRDAWRNRLPSLGRLQTRHKNTGNH